MVTLGVTEDLALRSRVTYQVTRFLLDALSAGSLSGGNPAYFRRAIGGRHKARG